MNFASDNAILTARHDRLGRKAFAVQLARAICKINTTHSFVLALQGAWGCGKSSVKNMVVEQIEKKRGAKPQTIEFSPWLISGHEQLVNAFFHDLIAKLGFPSKGEDAAKARTRLRRFATYFGMIARMAKATGAVAAAAGSEYGAAGTLIAGGVEQIADTAAAGADAEKELREAATKTLSEAKDELKKELVDRNRDLLIIIDDIDRLTSEEIRLLFRLIKANVDFPRFIYLLLFDREVVVNALDKLSESRGQAFLEKIVQVSFDIPIPAWGDLVQLMREEMLSTLTASRDAMSQWDEVRWERMIDQLRPYLANVRAVRRLMNAFRFSFSLFVHSRAFDANPEDLFGLEAIRLFEPALYATLFHHKGLLVRGERDWERIFAEPRDDAAARAAAKEKFLNVVIEERRDTIVNLLGEIFPNSRWQISGTESGQLMKGRRAGHPEYFERYFRLVVAEESLRRSELLAVLDAARDREQLLNALRSYQRRDRLHLLLPELRAHVETLRPHVTEVVGVFFDVGDDLPNRSWTYLGSEMELEIANLLLSCLLTIPDQQRRAETLLNAIRHSRGLAIPFHIVAMECNERQRQQAVEESLVVPSRLLPELKKVMGDKLSELQDSITKKPAAGSLGVLLHFWKEWVSVDAAASWLRANIDEDDMAWRFVSSATSSSVEMHSSGVGDLDLRWLVQFLPLEDIDRIIERFKTRTDPAAVQQVVQIYPTVRARFLSKGHDADEKPSGN